MSNRDNARVFNASLDKWGDKIRGQLDKAVRNIAFECAENIVVGGKYSPGSPVDTGFFRASWMVGLNEEPARPQNTIGFVSRLPQGGIQEMMVKLTGAKAGMRVFIINHTDYGISLEFGHSQQAPEGMVRLTFGAGQMLVDDVIRRMKAA